jgi:hypothetical protein
MDRITIANELLRIAEEMLINHYGAVDHIEWSAEDFFEPSDVKSFFSEERGFDLNGYIYKYRFGKYYLEIEEGEVSAELKEGSKIEEELIWYDNWAGKTDIQAWWHGEKGPLVVSFDFTAKESGRDLIVNIPEWFISDESCEEVSKDSGIELEEVRKIRDRLNEKLAVVYSRTKEVVKRYCREVALIAEEIGW